MRTLIIAAILSVALPSAAGHPVIGVPTHCLLAMPAAQLPPEGNPDHVKPPEGEHCTHDSADPAHNCHCHRECKQNTDDEGNPAPGVNVQEDPKCRSWCFKDHCHCPVDNCD